MPLSNELYVSQALSNFALSQAQDIEANFVAPSVFPTIRSDKQQGKYHEFPNSNWNRIYAKSMGPGEEVPQADFTALQRDYACVKKGVGTPLYEEDEPSQDAAVNIKRKKSRFVTQQMYMLLEKEWATAFFGGATPTEIWSNGRAGHASVTDSSTQVYWNQANSAPIKDVMYAKRKMHLATGGYSPNVGVAGMNAYAELKTNPEIADRIKHTSDEVIARGIIAKYFELDSLHVCGAVENTAEQGQSDSNAFICGANNFLLLYVNPNPGTSDTDFTAGLHFRWTAPAGVSADGFKVMEVPDPSRGKSVIQMKSWWQHKLVAASAGFMMLNAVNPSAS